MNLMKLATEYLVTLEYEVSKHDTDLLVGYKLSIGGEREGILVWVPDYEVGQSFSTQESNYLKRFSKAAKDYPQAQKKFMLVQAYGDISKDFRSKAKAEHHINLRVPILFFDTPFKWEESSGRRASSAAAELRKKGEIWKQERVSQPYVVVHGEDTMHSKDILDVFVHKFSKQPSAGLNIVVGPAGIGKSVLFEDLFSRLYSYFQKSKSQLHIFPRPLPVDSVYIRAAIAPTLKGIIQAFLRTEFAAPIEMDTFQWMLVNGFGIWLLDGLDEIIESDADFFNDLLDILTKPGSVPPTIMLCLRDSLLTTNQAFKEFRDEYSQNITIYELSEWDISSKRAFAKINLEEQKVEPFMRMLQADEQLKSLSSIPYYCKLIIDEYRDGKLQEQESYSELEVLNSAISSIVAREYGKGLLDEKLLPPDKLIELLQDLASENAALGFQGLTRDTVREYTEIILPSDLDHEALNRLTTHMVQLAFFRQGLATGSVRFVQEILEHYLLGECLYRNFCTNETLCLRELSRQFIPADWVTLKIVAIEAQNGDKVNKLLSLLKRSGLSDTTFRNLLQIYAYAVKDPAALKNIPFEERKIQGIRLDGFDLRSVSFRQCDLTDVEFHKCLLQDAIFQDAIINRTLFSLKDTGDLKGAFFGKMERLYSIRTQPRGPEIEYEQARKWLQKRTGVAELIVNPCPAALQLRYLFSKFFHPDGTAKRTILARGAAIRGKEFFDRVKTLEAAIRHGYLLEEVRYRDRVSRCEDDKYKEMVNYVIKLTLSPGLRALLNDICPVSNCQHIPI